jgi:pectin methylesterase-like acyl-CoA thioesterase
MKNSFTFFIIVLAVLFAPSAGAQVAGDYQSKTSGTWASSGSWQMYDGTTWNDAATAPSGASGTITILSGHTITIGATITISTGVTLNVNGNLTVSAATTISSTATVNVNGYLKVTAGGITATTSTPYSFTFNSGSTYEHGMAGGAIPMSVWNSGSTCLVTGTTSASPGNNTQPFYNFTWNCPSQSANLNLSWDNITIGGDLSVLSSGGTTYQFRMTNAATTRTITINGNVNVNGGYLTCSGSSGAAQYNITVKGNISVTSGKLNLCAGSGGFGAWRLWGNFSIGATGQLTVPSNTTVNTRLIFAGTNASQSYTVASGGINANLSYGVENNAAVTLNSPLTVGNGTTGFLVLTSGSFITSATNVLSLAAGASVNTGTGYVNGPMTQTVATASQKVLTFPLGKSVYRPVVLTVTQDAATSTTYTGEVFETTPPANTLPATLDAVSSARSYHFVKGTGANVSSATIQLNYDVNEGVDVSDKDKIRLAKDDGAGNWVNLGGSGTANSTGTILSNTFGTSTAYGTLTTNDFIVAHVNPASLASLATLTTNALTNISTTFATSGGVITNDGNAAITAKGVCWSTSSGPTTSNSFTNDGTTSSAFSSSITGLTAGLTYYVRAYATNSAGTAYGNEVSFTTLTSLSVPTLTTTAVSNIVNTTASSGGNISAWGGSAITDRGICWSTSHNPTIANDYNSVGAGSTGAFTTAIGGLTLGTTYYVRAYATNSSGTGYGDEASFTTPSPQPDVLKVVAQDGSGDYTTVYDAFNAVPSNYTGHWFIYVKAGTYYDKITLAQGKINVVLIGEDKNTTILTYDDYAGNNRTTHGVLSNGTNTSFSVAIDASDFQAQNITFQNTSTAAQAVALRTNGDRQSYYNCRMVGYQDTYYTQGGMTGPDRLYHKNCYLEGSVDFIFGRDVALFDSCSLYCNRNGGTLTAASTEIGYTYGYVFSNCTIGSLASGQIGFDGNPMSSFYLGRPWQTAPKTVFLNCYEPATLNSAGWTLMGPNPALYSEYGCTGPGSLASRAVIWSGTSQPSAISDVQAAGYTIANIFSKNNAGSGFSYSSNWTPALITYTGGLLPVELTAFHGSVKNGKAVLNWETATEVNSSGYEVERKAQQSGASWQAIGAVKAAGNSNATKQYTFTDKNTQAGTWQYRLKMIDNDGTYKYSNTAEVTIAVPKLFAVQQNYPNPFNPSTVISYQVPAAGLLTLQVFDVLGKEVATLVNEVQAAGSYAATFDGTRLASGIYYYQIRYAGAVLTKKMLLIK